MFFGKKYDNTMIEYDMIDQPKTKAGDDYFKGTSRQPLKINFGRQLQFFWKWKMTSFIVNGRQSKKNIIMQP
jgi:hypothetical protein